MPGIYKYNPIHPDKPNDGTSMVILNNDDIAKAEETGRRFSRSWEAATVDQRIMFVAFTVLCVSMVFAALKMVFAVSDYRLCQQSNANVEECNAFNLNINCGSIQDCMGSFKVSMAIWGLIFLGCCCAPGCLATLVACWQAKNEEKE